MLLWEKYWCFQQLHIQQQQQQRDRWKNFMCKRLLHYIALELIFEYFKKVTQNYCLKKGCHRRKRSVISLLAFKRYFSCCMPWSRLQANHTSTYIYTYMHTHTHTHIYIYVYIYHQKLRDFNVWIGIVSVLSLGQVLFSHHMLWISLEFVFSF